MILSRRLHFAVVLAVASPLLAIPNAFAVRSSNAILAQQNEKTQEPKPQEEPKPQPKPEEEKKPPKPPAHPQDRPEEKPKPQPAPNKPADKPAPAPPSHPDDRHPNTPPANPKPQAAPKSQSSANTQSQQARVEQNKNVHYNFRSQDRSVLRQHYQATFTQIDRSHRPHWHRGVYIEREYVTYIEPVPVEIVEVLPPVPDGYICGYWDGYVVVYDPATFFIIDVIDILS